MKTMKSSARQHAISTANAVLPPGQRWFTRLATLLLALATMASSASAGVTPVNSRPHGQSYGQWATAWWQWALSIPAATNPLLDTTGEFAGAGQSGSVWFLGGSFGDSQERSLTIPAGKAIFFPVHVWIFGAIANDCEPSVPGVTCDVPTLRASAAAAATAATVLEVSIDGQPVSNLRDYRALSPGGFNVTLPEGNVVGLPAGTYGPQVADGYWLMLTPFSVGQHTIVVHAVNPSFGIEYTLTYHIMVAPLGASSQ
jgi:hypothetical protein